MYKNKHLKITLAFSVLLLIYHVVYFIFGEQSYSQIGIRWDQQFYLNVTRDFESNLFGEKIPRYEFQRILPAGFIHLMMVTLDISMTTDNVLRVYDIYNSCLMFCTLWVWYLINQRAKTSVFGFLIGTIALFCNSAYLKVYLYQPINTDSAAIFLSALLLYGFVLKNKWLMAGTVFLSSFTWPSATFAGAILLLGSSFSALNFRKKTVQGGSSDPWVIAASVLIAAVPVAIVLMFVFVLKTQMPLGTTPIVYELLPLSLFFLGVYVFIITNGFLSKFDLSIKNIKSCWAEISYLNVLLCVLIILLTRFLIVTYASPQAGALNLTTFVRNITLSSVVVPLKFLIAHLSYFGPIVLLILFFWRRFLDQLFLYDLGLIAFVGIHLMQAMGAESRQLVFAYPFLVFVLIRAVHELNFKQSFAMVFLFTSLFFSRFWYTINQEPFPSLDDPSKFFQSFPWQNFAMFNGAWLSNQVYLIMLPIAAATAAIYYFVYIRPVLMAQKVRD